MNAPSDARTASDATSMQLPFRLSASLEELDLSPARGLERRTILELGQCNWIPARQNIIVLGPTGSGKSYLSFRVWQRSNSQWLHRALPPHFPFAAHPLPGPQ